MEITAVEWYVTAMLGFFGLLMLMLYGIFKTKDNPIYCWQLIASKNAAGEERADIDKVGKLVALIVITLLTVYVVATSVVQWTPLYLLYLIGLFVLYAGGIAGFSAWLRSKQPNIPGLPEIKP